MKIKRLTNLSRRGTDNKWTTPSPEDDKKTCTTPTTVYDTLVSVTQTVYTTFWSRRATRTSTVYSTQFPRVGCDVTKIASTTAATTTSCLGSQLTIEPEPE